MMISQRSVGNCLATLVLGAMPLWAMGADGPGVLRGEFVYVENVMKNPLTSTKCKPEGDDTKTKAKFAPILTDIAIGLAGKVAESLIDAVAAKTQPEATTLESVIPLDGFYGIDEKQVSEVAVDKGCLVFHNGVDKDGKDASIKAIFQIVVSPDNSAFRFTVRDWQFSRFLKPTTSRWFQTDGIRDFALKIEFLSPGSEGLGRKAVFVEHLFAAADRETVASAFMVDQKLPWFSSPASQASDPKGLNLPLNIKITLVETTKPNQFAVWTQDIAKEKKSDVVNLVKDAVKKTLDPNYEASENLRLAEAAGTAYASYKTAWDGAATQFAAKPAEPGANATVAERAAYQAALQAWQAGFTVNLQTLNAKKVAAKVAFATAGLPWPGDLPTVGG